MPDVVRKSLEDLSAIIQKAGPEEGRKQAATLDWNVKIAKSCKAAIEDLLSRLEKLEDRYGGDEVILDGGGSCD